MKYNENKPRSPRDAAAEQTGQTIFTTGKDGNVDRMENREKPQERKDGKALVTALFCEFFNDHDLSAADRWIHPDYIQHDYDVPPGREGFKAHFEKVFQIFPNFSVRIRRIVQEDDMVVMQGYGLTDPGKIEVLVVDIYRVKDGLLYEHWGTVQPLPPEQFGNPQLM